MLLVTGGAGFIGSNFVLSSLAICTTSIRCAATPGTSSCAPTSATVPW
jgi:hypothetical protein